MATIPCATCPWRREATAADIPNYDPELARGLLATTCGRGDAMRSIMACHGSTDTDMRTCIGYAASDDGYANINVRLMAARGKLDLNKVYDDCAELDLHATYAEVLDKLEGANR